MKQYRNKNYLEEQYIKNKFFSVCHKAL